ncbi:hypothetical protein SAMN02745121_08114 [Nannocystis exedens]|uniref:Tetratricopeptide repeat-containing protein n=1 Tax=Nannocystis exedens TaxID=54 RepID=A0A1I2HST5_9BACT|nr:hypothetical protein [Nannocystis exedens]PCC69431.1 hypothetical protein NAEX_02453 [Nannocystis exedens]SFF31907.1 hypothetical protein SAMN02745121_08114 [Nannocystis exedens]
MGRLLSHLVAVSLACSLATPVRASEPATVPGGPTAAAEPAVLASEDRPAEVPTAPTETAAYEHEEVQQAYARAEQALAAGQFDEALTELNFVLAAAPGWASAYRLRAQVYGRLSAAHAPSAAFLRAEAQDLAYVVELEPTVEDRLALERRIDALYAQASEASQVESRRRRLRAPAMVLTALGIAGVAAGALLIGITPSDKPTAFGHRDNDIGGAVALGTGVALSITAAILGGLALRQTRRDQAVTHYYELAARRRVEWTGGPLLTRAGGGLQLGLRF